LASITLEIKAENNQKYIFVAGLMEITVKNTF